MSIDNAFRVKHGLKIGDGITVTGATNDSGLTNNSQYAIPSEYAVKQYVDSSINSAQTYIDNNLFWNRTGTTLTTKNINDNLNLSGGSLSSTTIYSSGLSNNNNLILRSTGNTTPAILILNNNTEVFRLSVKPITTANTGDIFMGYNAGVGITANDAVYNLSIGNNTLTTNTSGNWNVVIGHDSMKTNTTGMDNTVIGNLCMTGNTTGSYNVAVGESSLMYNTTGQQNTSIGSYSMMLNKAGQYNTSVGMESLFVLTTGSNNTSVGAYCLSSLISGTYNTSMGYLSSQYITGGTFNVAIGYRSLKGIKYAIGKPDYNVAIGSSSLMNVSSARGNVSVGTQSQFYNTVGISNVSVGSNSLMNVATGSYHTAIGGVSINEYTGVGGFSPRPTFTLTKSAGTTMSVGMYLYKVSFVLNIGETFASTESELTTSTNLQNVTISNIPVYTGPYVCSARKIYRTVVNTNGFARWLYLTTLSDNSSTTYIDSTLDANLGPEPPDYNGSIALGAYAQYFKASQFVVGSAVVPITEMIVGAGVYGMSTDNALTVATIPDFLFTTTGGYGTNSGGTNLILAGGFSTGTANGGSLIFKMSLASGSTNSLANSLTEISRIDETGLKVSYGTLTLGSGSTTYILPNTRGNINQVLKTDGSGNVTWQTIDLSSDTQIIFNSGGTLTGSSNLTWSNNTVQITGSLIATVSIDTNLLENYNDQNLIIKAQDATQMTFKSAANGGNIEIKHNLAGDLDFVLNNEYPGESCQVVLISKNSGASNASGVVFVASDIWAGGGNIQNNKLTVLGGAGLVLQTNGATGDIKVVSPTTFQIQTNNHTFYVDTPPVFYATQDQKIGINTSTPSSTLDIVGSLATTGNITENGSRLATQSFAVAMAVAL